MRFCGTTSDAIIRRYCLERRSLGSIVLGFFVGGELRGAGEMVFDTAAVWPKTCEVALSVEASFQDRGAGTELLQRLIVAGRNRWVSRIRMFWLKENVRMQAIAAKFDAKLIVGIDQVECEIRPPWPTHLSIIDEILADTASVPGRAVRTGLL